MLLIERFAYGTRIGPVRILAVALGFAGVMLVIRPGMEGFHPQALWGILTVAGLALRDLAARAIPRDCTDAQVSCWGLMAVALLGVLMMFGQGDVRVPTFAQSAMLFGAVAFGTIGYWAVTGATRTGEVSVVAPFRYARLVFAIIIGAVVFAEMPDVITLSGAGLIIGSGLYSFARERARKRALSLQGHSR